ncbi:MAG: hypothetical protein OSJ71_13980 [Acetatifactor sp.]|nr:hypothetical protein [Acetatifactor sp.]
MEYKYCENGNFEDLASGRVIYGTPGVPNFPVRLGNEIYRRCVEYLSGKKTFTVYDPCCGGGYLLTVLGFGNSNITRLLASDISEDMVSLTVRNLALLTRQGLDARERELKEYFGQYQKPSHREALDSLARLRNSLCHDVESLAFTADCTGIIPLAETPDIIITDVPYGNLAMWESSEKDSLREMYLQLSKIAHPHTILAVIMDKGQKYRGDAWVRLERQMIGKRKFEIYRLR